MQSFGIGPGSTGVYSSRRSSIHAIGNSTIIAIWDDLSYYEIDEFGNTFIGEMSERMISFLRSLLGGALDK